MILHGDCLVKLKELSDNSIDAVVTDPPYELGFMDKKWDSTGIANNPEMWKECLRVLKPGGHLLSFSGTRTYHRMASAIEDAGFEVRDMIEWVYGSGFPKSLNIGKAVDKLQGNEREVVGKSRNGANRLMGGLSDTETTTIQDITKGTSEWAGWGTALKPAHEPICMARKPLSEKTVAKNVLKYGTGGINIDESRVEHNEECKMMKAQTDDEIMTGGGKYGQAGRRTDVLELKPNGRFPANLIHDNSEEVRECFPSPSPASTQIRKPTDDKDGQLWNLKRDGGIKHSFSDSGNASRFFKSIKKDLHCSLCYDTIEANQLTRSDICKHTNVGNVEKSSENTQGTKESIAQKNATGNLKENLVQNVKSAGSLCDLCGTFIAHEVVGQKTAQSLGLIPGQVTITEPNLQILKQCLASFVELRGNTDTIPTMENLNLLFGYVFNAIENSTQNYEDTKSIDKNRYRSLAYYPKASKSERNKGCEDIGGNKHCTVKPIALMEYLINMVTREGQVVLDPFAGSGSTLVAAKRCGRKYVGIEMSDEYIKIIEARLTN